MIPHTSKIQHFENLSFHLPAQLLGMDGYISWYLQRAFPAFLTCIATRTTPI